MSTNKRWIVTDMDDTMIKHYGKPSEKVRDLWNQLSRSRTNLVVATGQSHIKVMDKFLENNLELPNYIIANQGTVIYNPKTAQVMKVFCLTYAKVIPILKAFLRIGGEERYIRVCTLDKVIVVDTEESRNFYKKNPQSNIEFTTDIWAVLKSGNYTKLVLSASFDLVNHILRLPLLVDGVTLVNSGNTSFGGENYYRLELVASDKLTAAEFLILGGSYETSAKLEGNMHVLCLGDEITDYGLAEVALFLNFEGHNTGHFAIINSGSKGNINLSERVQQRALSLGYENRLIFVPGVEDDGWVKAVLEWQTQVERWSKKHRKLKI